MKCKLSVDVRIGMRKGRGRGGVGVCLGYEMGWDGMGVDGEGEKQLAESS